MRLTTRLRSRLRQLAERLPVTRRYEERLAEARRHAEELELERQRLHHLVVHLERKANDGQQARAELAAARARLEEMSRHLWVPPAHFYSPIPDVEVLARERDRIYGGNPGEIVGVDLRLDAQWSVLGKVATLAADVPFTDHRRAGRFWFDNPSYSWGDATVLFGVLCHLRPRRIVEIGSGFSTACMLDTLDHIGHEAELTLIEPYADQIRELLRPSDFERLDLAESPVQHVPLDLFQRLQAGDVLFIDSTHVLKTGGDVHYELLEVLPRLNPGVIVHIHDVFPGFEYPLAWLMEGRAWNEAYALRALLIGNPGLEILVWPVLLYELDRARATAAIPNLARNPGGCLWLRRTGA